MERPCIRSAGVLLFFSSVMPSARCEPEAFFLPSGSPKAIFSSVMPLAGCKALAFFLPSGSPKAISVGLVSAERSFFAAFAFGLCGFLFHPCYIFSPGQGLFLFPPPADFPSPFRQNSAAQHGPAVVPHLNLYKHKNTRFGPQKRPKIGCFFFPKSCGGKNTKTLSALIRSRRCPGRSPRR